MPDNQLTLRRRKRSTSLPDRPVSGGSNAHAAGRFMITQGLKYGGSFANKAFLLYGLGGQIYDRAADLNLRRRRRALTLPKGKGPDRSPWYLDGAVPAQNCIAAYQPKGANSYAESKINLSNPGTYDAVEGTAPSWASNTGWVFASAGSTHLKTGIVPNSMYSWIARVSSVTAGVQYLFGESNSQETTAFGLGEVNGTSTVYIQGQLEFVARALSGGVLAAANQRGYYNGVDEGVSIGAWSPSTATYDIYIGARNSDGLPANYANYHLIAASFYDIPLSPAQVAALTARMQLL